MLTTTTTTETPARESIAPLKVVDFEKLLAHDPVALKDLLEGAQNPGFFFLDLRGPSSKEMLTEVDSITQFSIDYFAQPQETKVSDFRPNIDRGYKPGKGYETLEIARDEFINRGINFTGLLGTHEVKIARFTEWCDSVTKVILRSLLSSLGLPAGYPLDSDAASNSGFKFISVPTSETRDSAPDTTHTDGGILTLLWCSKLSSQILDPKEKEWRWAVPGEGQVLVNVADTLDRETGGRLHSCIHRVSQPADGVESRHMITYHLRPAL